MELQEQDINHKIDQFEALMLENFETVDAPLTHKFVPGMYIREIFMPKGAIVTSLIHKTTHPYFIMKGKVSVFSENDGTQLLEAGHRGITTPNTRRVLNILEDTIWITCHPTDVVPTGDSEEEIEEAVRKVGEKIIDWRQNEVLGCVIKNNVLIEEHQKLENV